MIMTQGAVERREGGGGAAGTGRGGGTEDDSRQLVCGGGEGRERNRNGQGNRILVGGGMCGSEPGEGRDGTMERWNIFEEIGRRERD